MARPITYDRNEVLDKVVNLFWLQGFSATSISQLVKATDMKPASLYAAFDSKEGIFHASVDHYGRRSVDMISHLLEDNVSPMAGLKAYFNGLRVMSEKPEDEESRRGCFLVNTLLEMGPINTSIRDQVFYYLDQIEAVFRTSLQRAKELDEVASDTDVIVQAKVIMNTIRGLRVLHRAGGSVETLDIIVAQLYHSMGVVAVKK